MNRASYRFTETDLGYRTQKTAKIPIRVINRDTGASINLFALVDTGANNCTFPSMVSLTIGLPLNETTISKGGSRGISGIDLTTYKHWVDIELLDSTRKRVLRTLTVMSNTLERNDIPPLLGVNYFLDSFKINLDFPNNNLDFDW